MKVKKKKINIRFKLVSNVSKYQIMYSTKKSFKNKKVVTVRSGNVDYKEIKKEKDLFYQGTGYQQKWKSWCVECSEKSESEIIFLNHYF